MIIITICDISSKQSNWKRYYRFKNLNNHFIEKERFFSFFNNNYIINIEYQYFENCDENCFFRFNEKK